MRPWICSSQFHFSDASCLTEDNKANGSLAPFDPSAHYVHPRSRIRLTFTIAPRAKNPALKGIKRKGRKAAPEVIDLSSDTEDVPDSEDDGDTSDEDMSDEYGRHPKKKSSRATKKHIKNVPFSPRRTRAKKGFAAADLDVVDEDSDDIEEVAPTRKSSRSTKNSKAKYRETDDYMEVDSDGNMATGDEDEVLASFRKAKPKKKPSHRTSSRPAYGHFRSIHDLEEDDFSDSETAALRAHRAICEKCHRLPANELINAASKKKLKGGKRRKDEDLDDFDGDEMEMFRNLGGWVRWRVKFIVLSSCY